MNTTVTPSCRLAGMEPDDKTATIKTATIASAESRILNGAPYLPDQV